MVKLASPNEPKRVSFLMRVVYNGGMTIEKQLLDKKGNDALTVRGEQEAEFIDKVQAREAVTGRELEVVADTERDVKLPLKVLYEQDKIDVGKLPIWYLQALGSMTIKEYNEFVKSHQAELNINEIAASDLLSGVLAKDATATARFWDLQKTLLKSKNVIQQINNINIGRDEAVRNIIDDISASLFEK